MFCSQCGKELEENTRFCISCGKENINFSKNSTSLAMESTNKVNNMKNVPAIDDQFPPKNTSGKKKKNWILIAIIFIGVLLVNGRLIFPDLIKLFNAFQSGNIGDISAVVGGLAGWLLGSFFLICILYYGISIIDFTNKAARKNFISGLVVIIVVIIFILVGVFLESNPRVNNASSLLSFANSLFSSKDCKQFFNYFQDGELKTQFIEGLYNSNNHDWQKCNMELEKEQNDVVSYNEIAIAELQDYTVEYDIITSQQPTNILLYMGSRDNLKRIILINYDPESGYKVFNKGTIK